MSNQSDSRSSIPCKFGASCTRFATGTCAFNHDNDRVVQHNEDDDNVLADSMIRMSIASDKPKPKLQELDVFVSSTYESHQIDGVLYETFRCFSQSNGDWNIKHDVHIRMDAGDRDSVLQTREALVHKVLRLKNFIEHGGKNNELIANDYSVLPETPSNIRIVRGVYVIITDGTRYLLQLYKSSVCGKQLPYILSEYSRRNWSLSDTSSSMMALVNGMTPTEIRGYDLVMRGEADCRSIQGFKVSPQWCAANKIAFKKMADKALISAVDGPSNRPFDLVGGEVDGDDDAINTIRHEFYEETGSTYLRQHRDAHIAFVREIVNVEHGFSVIKKVYKLVVSSSDLDLISKCNPKAREVESLGLFEIHDLELMFGVAGAAKLV